MGHFRSRIAWEKTGIAGGILTFLVGLVLFVDDLHYFITVPDYFHFLLDFDPYIILGFQFHHLYLGITIMLVGLYIATKSDN